MIQPNVSVGEAVAEANISDNIECDKLPCLFRNYRELFNRFKSGLNLIPYRMSMV